MPNNMENVTTDEELYNEFLRGDNAALDELLIRHKDGLTWFLYGIVRNENDAEDLMMDTFALLISKNVSFKNNSTFKTWLYGIGRNLARKHLRKHKFEYGKEGDILQEIVSNESFAGKDILSEIIDNKEKNDLYQALGSLKEEYATVLYLQYIEQLSIEEISRIMKKSAKQIYNLSSRAKTAIKRNMVN